MHEGEDVQLSLEAGGKPSPTLQWFHGSQPLPGQTDPVLDILEVHATDAGFYSCEASAALSPPSTLHYSTQVSEVSESNVS